VVGAGEGLVARSAQIFSGDVRSGARGLTVRVPLAELNPMIRDLDSATVRLVPASSEPLSLLSSYVSALQQSQALARPELQHIAVTHVHDLVTLVAGATRDGAERARRRGMRAARLRSVEADIARHLGRHDLSAEAVAARHAISPRYLRLLFEGEGTTFSEYVLGMRLAQAHRMLSDARHDSLSISAIAFSSGFGDLSYFNRAFRRRYGATPSDVREGR